MSWVVSLSPHVHFVHSWRQVARGLLFSTRYELQPSFSAYSCVFSLATHDKSNDAFRQSQVFYVVLGGPLVSGSVWSVSCRVTLRVTTRMSRGRPGFNSRPRHADRVCSAKQRPIRRSLSELSAATWKYRSLMACDSGGTTLFPVARFETTLCFLA